MSQNPRLRISIRLLSCCAIFVAALAGCQKPRQDGTTADQKAESSSSQQALAKASASGDDASVEESGAQAAKSSKAKANNKEEKTDNPANSSSDAGAQKAGAERRSPANPDAKPPIKDEAEKHRQLGLAAIKHGNNKEVNDEFRKALELRHDFREAFNEYGAYLVNNGLVMDASELYGEGTKIWDDADFHNDFGVVYIRMSSMRDARKHFELALDRDAEHADAYYNLGLVLLNGFGQLEPAIEQLHLAIKFRATYPDAHFNLGRAYARKGELDKSVVHFKQAIKLAKPRYYNGANFQMGKVLEKQGKLKEAIVAYNEELRNAPADSVVRYAIGLALAELGNDEQAVSHFLECVRNRPDHADAHYQLALILPRLSRIEEAIAHNQDALNLRPDWPEALNSLAWLLATTGKSDLRNPKLAVSLAERARELADYKMPLVLDTLAAAYAEAGRFEEAAKLATQAAELAKNSNQEKEAQEMLERAKLYQAGKAFHEEAPADAP